MAIVRYRPVRDVFDMRSEMNRLFDGFFRGFPPVSERLAPYGPDVDIKETDDGVLVSVEIPGMEQKDIKLTVRENVLSLRGEKKREEEVKNTDYLVSERTFGGFERSFTLPTNIQADKVTAVYKNGVLNITLPKAEEAKPKEISVKVA